MDEIVEKIRKLLAKANGTENETEAALFAAKAAEMLQRHNLDASAITQGEAEVGVTEILVKDINTNEWRIRIYSAVAELYFSRIYLTWYIDRGPGGTGAMKERKGVMIVGKPHNAEIAISMSQYLIKTTMRLAKEFSTYRKDVLQLEFCLVKVF